MVEKTALNPETPRRRRGRPSKQEEVRQALAALGCDPGLIDPLRVLAGIAADETIAPTARVAAAKALLGQRDPAETKQPGKGKAQARLSKRVRAQRAAATAGGAGSGWGDDLAWSDGRRRQ